MKHFTYMVSRMSVLVRAFPSAWPSARAISHYIPEDCSKERVPETQETAIVTHIVQTRSHFDLFSLKTQCTAPNRLI